MSSSMPYGEYSLLSKDEDVYGQIDRIKKWLDGLSAELEEEIRAELDAVMQKILSAAIDLCPKDTGALASSINLESGAIQAGDFYGANIYAGSEDVVNPKTGVATSQYAQLVHDGHAMRDGTFWEGVPFLEEAMLMYFDELESIVDKVMSENGWNRED